MIYVSTLFRHLPICLGTFEGLNQVVTFSGYKATLCTEEITVVGNHCTIHW
jgi:hypothetical protein